MDKEIFLSVMCDTLIQKIRLCELLGYASLGYVTFSRTKLPNEGVFLYLIEIGYRAHIVLCD